MKNATRLLAATVLGSLVTVGVQAVSQQATKSCTGSADLSRFNKQFDDLEQAMASLQTQSQKAASDSALANTNSQRQLADISAQIANVNAAVVSVSGRLR
jgi:hypothetical protein